MRKFPSLKSVTPLTNVLVYPFKNLLLLTNVLVYPFKNLLLQIRSQSVSSNVMRLFRKLCGLSYPCAYFIYNKWFLTNFQMSQDLCFLVNMSMKPLIMHSITIALFSGVSYFLLMFWWTWRKNALHVWRVLVKFSCIKL